MKNIEILANRLIKEHLPEGWTFKWNNAVTINGMCYHDGKQIELSKRLTPHRTLENVTDTILHEIAHGLCGAGEGHGQLWKRTAVRLGARPWSESEDDASQHIPPKWIMIYPKTGEIVQRWFRRPNKSTFARLPDTWMRGKKAETYGKLIIKEYAGEEL